MRIIRAGSTKQPDRLYWNFPYIPSGWPDTTRPDSVPAHFAGGLRVTNNTPYRKSVSSRRRKPNYILTA
jgi:hypothetical protein